MNIYQHILLAVDLSAASKQVAIKAQQLAQMNQAKLTIVHVAELMPMVDFNYDAMQNLDYDIEINQVLFANAEKNLAAFISESNLNPQQKFLEQGDPRDEIIRIAEENQVDLIVVGSHGRHGFALLLGSTANSILHHAKCDVLAVRLTEE
jgi:universal stress protein A